MYYTVVFGKNGKIEGEASESVNTRFDIDFDLQDNYGCMLSDWREAEKGGGIYLCDMHSSGKLWQAIVLTGDSPFQVQLKEESLGVR